MGAILLISQNEHFAGNLPRYLAWSNFNYHQVASFESADQFIKDHAVIVLMIDAQDTPYLDLYRYCNHISSNIVNLPIIISYNKNDIYQGSYRMCRSHTFVTHDTPPIDILITIKMLDAKFHKSDKLPTPPSSMVKCDLRIDHNQSVVLIQNKEIKLKRTEFLILQLFLEYPGRIISRENILEAVWADADIHEIKNLRIIDSHINQLRKSMQKFDIEYLYIETIREKGYRLVYIEQAKPLL